MLAALEDQATVGLPSHNGTRSPRIAFTTDSFVVRPLFFPGGDIGKLAVHGTVNDLAVGGATPLYLTAAFILEEGLAIADLERIAASMQQACAEAGVALVTGDTKVVDRGKGDGVFITTTGIGVVPAGPVALDRRSPARRPDRGFGHDRRPRHRHHVGSRGDRVRDRAGKRYRPLERPGPRDARSLSRHSRDARPDARRACRARLNELAAASKVGVGLDEAAIPIRGEVRAACEMLGLDPLYVANEGKLIAVVPPGEADRLVEVMRAHPLGRNAAVIGEVVAEHPGMVTLRSLVGGERVVAMLSGEQLPRIC